MKNLLIPTDFSACAEHAVDAGMKLAERFGAKVHLLTKVDLKNNWVKMTVDERSKLEETNQIIRNALVLLKDIKERYPELNITTSYSGDKLINAIKDYAKKHGVDFIVMGSHGASGKNEYFIGSNTQKVIRSVHCPVLVVKDKIEELDFSKVVFASSFNENEKAPFLRFKDFVKHFLPEIHLVAIHTSSMFDPPYILSREAMESFKELCHPFTCHTHIFRDFTVERGIRSFAEEMGAQLVGISNYNRHPIKRVLMGSNVEALINHSTLPVLSIDYVEKEVPVEQEP
jgi:nucleotide-binding universal stress UspA family protein